MEKESWLLQNLNTNKEICSIAFSCDLYLSILFSKYIAPCGVEKYINLWNINNPKRNLTLEGHTKKIQSITFSPNENILASASYDNTIKLWYPGSSNKTKTIKGHTAPVKSVYFFADGKTLLSASDDKSVKLWDIDTQKFKGSFLGHNNWVNSAKVNSDMSLICSGG